VLRVLKKWLELDWDSFKDADKGLGVQMSRLVDYLRKTESPLLAFLGQTLRVQKKSLF